MFKKLDFKDKHTNCQYCNYMGCNQDDVIHHIKFTIWLKFTQLKKQVKSFIYNLGALDYSRIDDVEIDGINHRDHPDYCDAFITSATYKGRDMTEKELDRLNNDSDYVYECVMNHIY